MVYSKQDIEDRMAFFEKVLKEQLVYILYQPIFSMKSSKIFGYEALSRFKLNTYYHRIDEVFKDAQKLGKLDQLESLVCQCAVDHFVSFSRNHMLFLNMEGTSLRNERLLNQIVNSCEKSDVPLSHIVIELTEREVITNYQQVRNVMKPFRKKGLKFAIDDLGEGHSSLRSIIELEPDYIKMDRHLITNVHRNKLKQKMVSAIIQISQDFSYVVAEGIEKEEELTMLKKLGLSLGQGFFLGRPGRLSDENR